MTGLKRGIAIGVAIGVGVTAIGGGLYAYLGRSKTESARVRELRAIHASLQRQLETHLDAEPLLREPDLDAGDLTVAIRTPYLGQIIREVGRRYLDRVHLDLSPDIRVREKGAVKKKMLLGSMSLGEWRIDLDIDRLAGVLGAETPDLVVAEQNKVRVTMPVRLMEARGSGSLKFSWDSWNVANLVCRDFQIQERLQAVAFPDAYRVRGAFAFSEDKGDVVARPEFPAEKFRVRIDLTPESWAKVEAAVRAQDTFSRCGLAIDPPTVLPQLKALANTGFEFKLPRSLFRPVTMPAHFRSRVFVQETEVDVTVEPRAMRLTSEHLWYAASFKARIMSTPPPTATPTPRGKRKR